MTWLNEGDANIRQSSTSGERERQPGGRGRERRFDRRERDTEGSSDTKPAPAPAPQKQQPGKLIIPGRYSEPVSAEPDDLAKYAPDGKISKTLGSQFVPAGKKR
jgi:hypothetical protein